MKASDHSDAWSRIAMALDVQASEYSADSRHMEATLYEVLATFANIVSGNYGLIAEKEEGNE